MKCDEVLPALEMGSFWTRRKARRHLATCPACAAAVAHWQGSKCRLASPEPLTDYHRRLWRTATDRAVEPWRSHRLRWAIGIVVAGILIVGTLLLLPSRNHPIPESPREEFVRTMTPVEVYPVPPEYVAKQFAPLEQKLDALEDAMNRFILAAEKRDAELQLARLLQDYPKRENPNP